jgi:hypothetical protein
VYTLFALSGTALQPVVPWSDAPRSDGTMSTAILIAVAGIAMILATAGLIFVVVRRKPAPPHKSVPAAAEPLAEESLVQEPGVTTAS